MKKQPDLTYQPPINDPREDGVKHWDQIRQELMLTRDALGLAEGDLNAARRRIAELESDKEKLAAAREVDRNECVTLRTSLEFVGRMILAVLKGGAMVRKGDNEFAPNILQETLHGQVKEIESVLRGDTPQFLRQET